MVKFILIQSVASYDTTKKCDDFWLLSAESFPMVYIMNDFAAIIFRRYYTLNFLLTDAHMHNFRSGRQGESE